MDESKGESARTEGTREQDAKAYASSARSRQRRSEETGLKQWLLAPWFLFWHFVVVLIDRLPSLSLLLLWTGGLILGFILWPSTRVSFLTVFVLVIGLVALSRLPLRQLSLRAFLLRALLEVQTLIFLGLAHLGPKLDRIFPWHRFHRYLGLPILVGLRERLRKKNLLDTSAGLPTPSSAPLEYNLTDRTSNGTFNDPTRPEMGSFSFPFGRNMPGKAPGNLPGKPNPREISIELLAREEGNLIAATSLNLLAAAWIQFMVHDWFRHEKRKGTAATPREDQHAPDTPDHMVKIPFAACDSWPPAQDRDFRLRIPLTEEPVATQDKTGAPIYRNHASHWWDGSQLYGSDAAIQRRLRSHRDGKLLLWTDHKLPLDETTGLDLAGFQENWWIGLNLLHTLFTLEHNAICDHLQEEYPTWSDDELFARARLINVGLMAKIHTVEWTPAILNNPPVVTGMKGNWWGILGRKIRRNFGRLLSEEEEVFSGILGSVTDHHKVPYALTEEFVSVYRMHPLMPDEFRFYSAKDGSQLTDLLQSGKNMLSLSEVSGPYARRIRDGVLMEDLLYSFGILHPGAITLGNYPNGLRNLETQDGLLLDLAAVDILRDRERGVPRYNEFRKALGLHPVRRFGELVKRFKTPEERAYWSEKLKKVYENDIESVDLMVGLFAEKPPKGFGFSDTAFRIFILMASRRLKSDRFFTTDYRPEVYTQLGLDWIENTDMGTLLLRHFPVLRPFLRSMDNAFQPWPLVEQLHKISSGKSAKNGENTFPVHQCVECAKA
ncbi:MAG: peroxidase [Deltaproteobacteria bacterium]|nr:peroxidase [Deltaproteobacteria bacterium]